MSLRVFVALVLHLCIPHCSILICHPLCLYVLVHVMGFIFCTPTSKVGYACHRYNCFAMYCTSRLFAPATCWYAGRVAILAIQPRNQCLPNDHATSSHMDLKASYLLRFSVPISYLFIALFPDLDALSDFCVRPSGSNFFHKSRAISIWHSDHHIRTQKSLLQDERFLLLHTIDF